MKDLLLGGNGGQSVKITHLLIVPWSIFNATVLRRYPSQILAEILTILAAILIFFSVPSRDRKK
jgi:hypothetical protein